MHVVGRGNGHGVNAVGQLIKQLAVVLIKLRAGIFLALRGAVHGIHVAQGHDVFAIAVVGVAPAFAHHADGGNVQLAVQVGRAQKRRHAEGDGAGGEGGSLEKPAAANGAGQGFALGLHGGDIKRFICRRKQKRCQSWQIFMSDIHMVRVAATDVSERQTLHLFAR